ncbi:MAG: DNA polymerase IV [Bacteroidales bacterium]|nr:DNA polymerase IV [Bacteroidales bacterium]
MIMSERSIAHLDLDSFYVSVERVLDSSLKYRPVIVGGSSDRGVVTACSYETRKFGVHSGMPIRAAKQACPEALIIRGNMEVYSRYSNIVTSIIAESAPVYEKASIDEHYLDLTGLDEFFGVQKWAHELRMRIIKETGLPLSLGLSENKTVAKIATGEAKPNGEIYVQKSLIQQFLDPLQISKIPMLGKKSFNLLRSMGVSNIRSLREIPLEAMLKVLGKNGQSIWEKAHGIDNSPVVQYSERKSISSEHTFERDTSDINAIHTLLSADIENLCFKLRKENLLTSVVAIKIRYFDFKTYTAQKTIPYTSFDHEILKTAIELFDNLYNRRMLIRLAGVRLGGLVRGAQQLNLFEDHSEMTNLYNAIDDIRNRFGIAALKRANSISSKNKT